MSKRGAEFYLTDRNFNSYNEDDDDDGEVNKKKKKKKKKNFKKIKIIYKKYIF